MQPPGRILCSFPKYSCKVIELIGSTMSEILEDTAMDGRNVSSNRYCKPFCFILDLDPLFPENWSVVLPNSVKEVVSGK